MDFIFHNITPIGIITAVILVLWLLARFITKPGPPVEQLSGDFTYEQLNEFDGIKKPQTFLALKGIIYDVSGVWFYRKGGPYGVFAGHDASINLGKMSHDSTMLDKWE
mgnify:CR=1 FL=1